MALDIDSPFTVKQEFDANSMPIYVGEATPGTPTSASGWRIRKFTYDGSNLNTDIKWASGTNSMDKIWDNRATYTYS